MTVPSWSTESLPSPFALEGPRSLDRTYDLRDMQLAMHLLQFGQILCEQAHNDVTLLCQEVHTVTHGRAQLHLERMGIRRSAKLPPGILLTLPVQFRHLMYGTLSIEAHCQYPDQPAIQLFAAQMIAQICSWLLYTLEQSIFLHNQCHDLESKTPSPLTKREQEVLALMCKGYSKEAISSALNITVATVGKHRQHIYEQLGVHSEHDALLVAYHNGLFSIIDKG